MLIEYRDRLHVRGVREHVDHARRRQSVAALVHEHRGIARERPRRAAHVDDATQRFGRILSRQRLHELDGAVARRIDQRRGRSRPSGASDRRIGSKRLAARKRVLAESPLLAAFSCARFTSAALPSTPTTPARPSARAAA